MIAERKKRIMTLKFTQKNHFIPEDQVDVDLHARLVEGFLNEKMIEFRLYEGLVPVQIGSIANMPCIVKGTEEEAEVLKTLGFGSGSGVWAVLE